MPAFQRECSAWLARLGLILLGIVLAGGGSLTAWECAGAPLVDAWQSRDWQPCPAELLRLDLETGAGARLVVAYRYRLGGVTFIGTRYGLHAGPDNADAQRAAYVDLLYRRRLTAWVDPRDPRAALLDRQLHFSVLLLGVPALAVAALGGFILLAAGQAARAALRRRQR
jgi:hypothetical protein